MYSMCNMFHTYYCLQTGGACSSPSTGSMFEDVASNINGMRRWSKEHSKMWNWSSIFYCCLFLVLSVMLLKKRSVVCNGELLIPTVLTWPKFCTSRYTANRVSFEVKLIVPCLNFISLTIVLKPSQVYFEIWSIKLHYWHRVEILSEDYYYVVFLQLAKVPRAS